MAKRLVAPSAALLSAAFGSGCPVYSDSASYQVGTACYYATDCPGGYRCSGGFCVLGPPLDGSVRRDASATDSASADSAGDVPASDVPSNGDGRSPVYCGNPSDCAATDTCSADGTCHSGDCSMNACINQFQCAVVTSGPTNVGCVHADSQACAADHQCFKNFRCVDGRCTALSDLCTDRTQCPAGDACVEGKCLATCTANSQCPAGYLCRLALGVCDVRAQSCTATSDCGSRDLVCVDGGCAPRCGAVGACGDGGPSACVDNGCLPAQKIRDVCQVDGSMAGCPAGRICVHHACYTPCQAPNTTACAALASTPVCRSVMVGTTTYSICGTAETLGTECDPTAGKACTGGKTCIDGFCR